MSIFAAVAASAHPGMCLRAAELHASTTVYAAVRAFSQRGSGLARGLRFRLLRVALAVRSASTEGHRDAYIYWRGRPATVRPPLAGRLGGIGIRPRGGSSRPGPRHN